MGLGYGVSGNRRLSIGVQYMKKMSGQFWGDQWGEVGVGTWMATSGVYEDI